MPVFCRHALGLEGQDIYRPRGDPPMGALLALEAGTGIPVERLQEMAVTRVLSFFKGGFSRLSKFSSAL
jgi:hypothetical protein